MASIQQSAEPKDTKNQIAARGGEDSAQEAGQESGPVAALGTAEGTGREGSTGGVHTDEVAELGADQGMARQETVRPASSQPKP